MSNKEIFKLWDSAHKKEVYHDDINNTNKNLNLSFTNQSTAYFFHATTNLNYDLIRKSKRLSPSGGCLVDSIYCTPIYACNKNTLRLHNLGGYYYFEEIPNIIKMRRIKDAYAKGYIIEVKNINNNLACMGLNYLLFGSLHLYYYHEKSSYFTKTQLQDIELEANYRLKNTINFFNVIFDMNPNNISIHKAKRFVEMYNDTIPIFKILGYVLFEILSNYIYENQNDDISNIYKNINEVNNWNLKQMIYNIYPFLLTKFSLENIRFDYMSIANYLESHKIISNFNKEDFLISIIKMLISLLKHVFMSDDGIKVDDIKGHIVHRILKKNEFATIYIEIERKKAIDIQQYWKEKKYSVIYNNIYAKGEIGINPVITKEFKYNIYNCNNIIADNNFFYLSKGAKYDIKIAEDIVLYQNSLLR